MMHHSIFFNQKEKKIRKNMQEEMHFFFQWRNRFVEGGCNATLITQILKKKQIDHYDLLYQAFIHLPKSMRKKLTQEWELFCLSGEERAFCYAVRELKLNHKTHNRYGENALHYAALSNNPNQIYRALKLGIAWNSESHDHCNILHFSVFSRELKQLQTVLALETNMREALSRHIKEDRNIFHFAAFTGIVEIMELVKNLVDDIHAEDIDGFNALDYARANYIEVKNTEQVEVMQIKNAELAIQSLSKMGLTSDRDLKDFHFLKIKEAQTLRLAR